LKNKKHYITLANIAFLLFAISFLVMLLMGMLGFLLTQDEGAKIIILPASIFLIISLLLSFMLWHWVEIDKDGIHAKKLFKHIYTIKWDNIARIEKVRLRDDRGVNFRFIVFDRDYKIEKYKSIFNKANGIIKIRPTTAVEEALINFCTNQEKIDGVVDDATIRKLIFAQEASEELVTEEMEKEGKIK